MNDDMKRKAESLIYRMQKTCSYDSWIDFLEDEGLSEEEGDFVFKSIADSLGLDGTKFYHRIRG
jgi:hypothetical protein